MNDCGAVPASRSAIATSSSWSADKAHAGSVRVASPVMAKAWHRQPPQSISLRSQERHGSGIHSVPRKAWNALELCHISSRLRWRTLSKDKVVMDSAAWQGSTWPDGEILRKRPPHPPIQDFGRLA